MKSNSEQFHCCFHVAAAKRAYDTGRSGLRESIAVAVEKEGPRSGNGARVGRCGRVSAGSERPALWTIMLESSLWLPGLD